MTTNTSHPAHTYPDQATSIQMLAEWHQQHDRIMDLMEGINATFGLLPEGPLSETVWGLFDSNTKAIGQLLGDQGDWLIWHYLENDMGAHGMEAGYAGQVHPIKTHEDLYRLIEQSRSCA